MARAAIFDFLQYPDNPLPDLTAAEAGVLKRGGFSREPEEAGGDDPLVQTVAEYAALLESSLSTVEAARKLGVEPRRIRQRLTATPPTLYGLRIGSTWYVPEFQFDGDGLVQGFGQVVSRLDPALHPVAVFRWFTCQNADLPAEGLGGRNLSPRDWLRMGLPVEPIAELAANLGLV
ncbi:MAG TPA: hypothetical protein VF173_36000 [Thermoanaerobaculia bacterium]|nr:hypothetical protein [Thermoanaerobaculia bacterium]